MRGGKPAKDPIALGIIGIAALLLFTFLAFTKRVPFVQGYRVEAVFHSSNQLRKGSPVRIAGVDVGRVVGIRAGDGATTIVTLEIASNGRPIHKDATLRIRPRLFLEGGFVVDMKPGSPSAPELGSGDTIPLPQTATPVQFHQILSTFDRSTRQSFQSILKETALALGGGGAQDFGRATKPLGPALRDAAIVAEAARGTEPGDLPGLIGSLARVTGALARHDLELANLITNLNLTMRAFASRDTEISASVIQLDAVLRETPPALRAIDPVLPKTEHLAVTVRPTLERLPGDLNQASDVLEQLRGAVSPPELPAAIQTLQPVLRVLPHLANQLTVVMRLTKPVADCLRQPVIPVLKSTIHDGDHSTGKPVWQDLVHAMVGLSSVAQSFDGNGSAVRYLAGGGDVVNSSGPVPGVGNLFGLAPDPILGANPLWFGPGSEPPLRADQPCRSQKPPNLKSRVGLPLPASISSSSAPNRRLRISRDEAKRLLDALSQGKLVQLEGKG
jgi:virulence factor Mce-like protein